MDIPADIISYIAELHNNSMEKEKLGGIISGSDKAADRIKFEYKHTGNLCGFIYIHIDTGLVKGGGEEPEIDMEFKYTLILEIIRGRVYHYINEEEKILIFRLMVYNKFRRGDSFVFNIDRNKGIRVEMIIPLKKMRTIIRNFFTSTISETISHDSVNSLIRYLHYHINRLDMPQNELEELISKYPEQHKSYIMKNSAVYGYKSYCITVEYRAEMFLNDDMQYEYKIINPFGGDYLIPRSDLRNGKYTIEDEDDRDKFIIHINKITVDEIYEKEK